MVSVEMFLSRTGTMTSFPPPSKDVGSKISSTFSDRAVSTREGGAVVSGVADGGALPSPFAPSPFFAGTSTLTRAE